jgi:hypothetical protein
MKMMTDDEIRAFVRAYGRNVAIINDEDVTNFVIDVNEGVDMSDYCGDFVSIMDALGMWHDAIKFNMEQAK